jgi:hypothetical protein
MFFEAGKTYGQHMKPYKAPELLRAFQCELVATNPTTGDLHAFGWYSVVNGWGPTWMTPGHWTQGWSEITADDEAPWLRSSILQHFKACHPEDAKAPPQPDGYEPRPVEECWHCGTSTPLGCACSECQEETDVLPAAATYHCPTCRRWWAYLNIKITTIRINAESDEPHARANEAGRCVVCDGTAGICQQCHKPRHDADTDHALSLLPCRECNGGSYPARPSQTTGASAAEEDLS